MTIADDHSCFEASFGYPPGCEFKNLSVVLRGNCLELTVNEYQELISKLKLVCQEPLPSNQSIELDTSTKNQRKFDFCAVAVLKTAFSVFRRPEDCLFFPSSRWNRQDCLDWFKLIGFSDIASVKSLNGGMLLSGDVPEINLECWNRLRKLCDSYCHKLEKSIKLKENTIIPRLPKKSSRIQPLVNLFVKAFLEKYEEMMYSCKDFTNCVQELIEDKQCPPPNRRISSTYAFKPVYLAPYSVMLQSSMIGKTRFLLDPIKENARYRVMVIYFTMFSNIGEISSVLLREILTTFKEKSLDESAAYLKSVYLKICTALFENDGLLRTAYLNKGSVLGDEIWDIAISLPQMDPDIKLYTRRKSGNRYVKKDVVVVFAIDEADHLLKTTFPDEPKYGVIAKPFASSKNEFTNGTNNVHSADEYNTIFNSNRFIDESSEESSRGEQCSVEKRQKLSSETYSNPHNEQEILITEALKNFRDNINEQERYKSHYNIFRSTQNYDYSEKDSCELTASSNQDHTKILKEECLDGGQNEEKETTEDSGKDDISGRELTSGANLMKFPTASKPRDISLFTILRRSIRSLKADNFTMPFILTSTFSRLANFMPKLEFDPSRREVVVNDDGVSTMKCLHRVFILQEPFDILARCEAQNGNFECTDFRVYLCSEKYIRNMMMFGRPIFGDMVRAAEKESNFSLLNLTRTIMNSARDKLAIQPKLPSELDAIALLGHTIGLGKFTTGDLASRIVQFKLGFLEFVDTITGYLEASFHQEPVIAVVAAEKLFSRVDEDRLVLLEVLKSYRRLTEIGYVDIGNSGEFVVRLSLFISKMLVPAIKTNYDQESSLLPSLPVKLCDMLGFLGYESREVSAEYEKDFLNGSVSFSHFIELNSLKVGDNMSALLHQAFARGSAILCPPNFQGVDMMFPILTCSGKLSWALVQVKSRQDRLNLNNEVVYQKMLSMRDYFAISDPVMFIIFNVTRDQIEQSVYKLAHNASELSPVVTMVMEGPLFKIPSGHKCKLAYLDDREVEELNGLLADLSDSYRGVKGRLTPTFAHFNINTESCFTLPNRTAVKTNLPKVNKPLKRFYISNIPKSSQKK